MTDLPRRLAELGDVLDVSDRDLAVVLVHAGGPVPAPARRRALLVAAALVVVTIGGVLLHPSSRAAIARSFGRTSVRIEHRPDLRAPAGEPNMDLPGPGHSQVVTVKGREILVSAISGRIDDVLIEKTIAAGTSVTEVTVNGERALWIEGEQHILLYRTESGVVEQRVAGNTLLWQNGSVLHRVEGFDVVDDALEFASSGT
jgi:hypothetical protein